MSAIPSILLAVLFRMIGSVLLAASCQQLSRTLHHTMLTHVLFSPVSFFDSTPRGRILNRFSVDLDAIDGRLFISGKQSVQGLLVTLSKIAVVGTQTPEVMIVAAVGAAIIAAGMVRGWKCSLTVPSLLHSTIFAYVPVFFRTKCSSGKFEKYIGVNFIGAIDALSYEA